MLTLLTGCQEKAESPTPDPVPTVSPERNLQGAVEKVPYPIGSLDLTVSTGCASEAGQPCPSGSYHQSRVTVAPDVVAEGGSYLIYVTFHEVAHAVIEQRAADDPAAFDEFASLYGNAELVLSHERAADCLALNWHADADHFAYGCPEGAETLRLVSA